MTTEDHNIRWTNDRVHRRWALRPETHSLRLSEITPSGHFNDDLAVRWLMFLRYPSDIDIAALVTGRIDSNRLYVSAESQRSARAVLARVSHLDLLMAHVKKGDTVRVFPFTYYDEGTAGAELLKDASPLQPSMRQDLDAELDGAYAIEIKVGASLTVFVLTKDDRLLFSKYVGSSPDWIVVPHVLACDQGDMCAMVLLKKQ